MDVIPADVARIGLCSCIAIASVGLIVRKTRRFTVIDEIPPHFWKKRKYLRGVVTTVGDGDNFRMVHRPLSRLGIDTLKDRFAHSWSERTKRLSWRPSRRKSFSYTSENTIGVRLAGVDAPECSHFGAVGQPYGPEALQWLKKELTGRVVRVKLLRRDQYGRAVGMVYYKTFWRWKNASMELLRVGLATVYEGQDAEYCGMLSQLKKCEEKAKFLRKGQWKRGRRPSYESPMDFKKRQKQSAN